MTTTMQLLDKALAIKKASRWCEDLNLDISTMSHAKRRGRLSPTLAGNLAARIGENPQHWIAIAAIEAEPESELKEALVREAKKTWLHS